MYMPSGISSIPKFIFALRRVSITLVGHFVSSPREREKRDRRDYYFFFFFLCVC